MVGQSSIAIVLDNIATVESQRSRYCPVCLIHLVLIENNRLQQDSLLSRKHNMSSTSEASTANQELDLPVQDKRTYHAFTLPKNGLRCLVIHDPVDETKNDSEEDEEMEEEDEEMEEDGEEGGENNKNSGGKGSGGGHKAAVSTTVAVGQLHDGANWPGRAHLTEHLLFLGSQKYPTENELDAYLNKHGGHSNAYTDLDHTCYFMDCSSNALQGALDRWAASMTAPLLQVGSVEREIQAIESEHQKNVLSDYWRFFQLSKRLMLTSTPKPNATSISSVEASKHPYASFGNGCFDSLVPQSASSATATPKAKEGLDEKVKKDDNKQARITALRDAVAEFVQLYYKAELMTLTVSSSHSIDDMVKWVTMYFSDVPSGGDDSRPLCHDPPPVLPNLTLDHWTLPVSLQVVPTREGRTLELQWPLPREMQSLYETKPTRILSHLLGHEGPGSLVALLRQQQWAQDLCADDVSRSNRHFCIFQVQIELTTTGWQHHVSDIVRLVFAYLQLLREGSGIPSWVYEELKVTAGTLSMYFMLLKMNEYKCTRMFF
jgi:secreted Zn-dependent insulinase-like peptidase